MPLTQGGGASCSIKEGNFWLVLLPEFWVTRILTVVLQSHRSKVTLITYDLCQRHSGRLCGLKRITHTKEVVRYKKNLNHPHLRHQNSRVHMVLHQLCEIYQTCMMKTLTMQHKCLPRELVHSAAREVATLGRVGSYPCRNWKTLFHKSVGSDIN